MDLTAQAQSKRMSAFFYTSRNKCKKRHGLGLPNDLQNKRKPMKKCPWKCIIFGRRFVIDFVSIWAPFWKLEDRFGALKIEYFWATGPRWSPRGLLDQFGVDLGLILEGFWEVLRRFLEGRGEIFGRTAVHRGDLRKC